VFADDTRGINQPDATRTWRTRAAREDGATARGPGRDSVPTGRWAAHRAGAAYGLAVAGSTD
jgi:hypothetical protein